MNRRCRPEKPGESRCAVIALLGRERKAHCNNESDRVTGYASMTSINPSGGVLAGNLMMASGLSRIGEVFNRIVSGEAERGIAQQSSVGWT